jgi:hypothetical protein
MLTTADITITGTPGDVALYNNPIAAITDIIRVSDGYTSYKISVSKTGYATKEILLTNAELKAYMENPLIVLLIEPGDVNSGYGLLYNWYATQPQSQVKYGCLYNWWAATDERGIAPVGFHVPTNDEAITLRSFIGGENYGYKLKETGIIYWLIPNNEADNSTMFSARGSGERRDGLFDQLYQSFRMHVIDFSDLNSLSWGLFHSDIFFYSYFDLKTQ